MGKSYLGRGLSGAQVIKAAVYVSGVYYAHSAIG